MPRFRRQAVPQQQTVVASAARTTNGNGSAVGGWNRQGAVAKLDVTAASGTPTLTVTIQDSPDGTTWTTRDTFGAKTGISNETRTIPSGLDVFQRVAWTITGGTPSTTFSVQFAAQSLALV